MFLSLAGLQFAHYLYLTGSEYLIYSRGYLIFLYSVAPAFYFSSRHVLFPQARSRWLDLFHLFPFGISQVLVFEKAFPLAFLIGAGYLIWLLKRVFGLRQQSRRFRLEATALMILLILAGFVLVLVSVQQLISMKLFIACYAVAIGTGFVILQWIMVVSPGFSGNLTEAVQASYKESTLTGVEIETVVAKLLELMEKEKVFTDERLNLSGLASRLNLSSHQLSELINTRIGTGFSRYIREQRVEEAKRQLLENPSASVLSIGLSVGFTSQSNFYAAFRDLVGIAPGEFRKGQALR